LTSLEQEKAYVHGKNDTFRITRSGQQYVEANRLLDAAKAT
jgi:hypothetical protein